MVCSQAAVASTVEAAARVGLENSDEAALVARIGDAIRRAMADVLDDRDGLLAQRAVRRVERLEVDLRQCIEAWNIELRCGHASAITDHTCSDNRGAAFNGLSVDLRERTSRCEQILNEQYSATAKVLDESGTFELEVTG